MRKDKFKKFKTKPNSKTEAAKKLRTVLFSRFIILALFLILQILFFLMFSLKLQSYIEYYLFASVAISAFFLLYFVNRPGENEFKFAWFFPILILPVFGILLYVMYKYNQGGIYLKKKVKKIMDDSAVFIPLKDEAQKITKDFEEVKDIAFYLYDAGNYPAYLNTETQYFPTGEDFFSDLIDELNKAKKFVFLEFFIVEPCQIMDKLLEILSRKVKEGVEVRILFDSIGSIALSSSLLRDYFTTFGISSKVWLKFIPVFNTGLNNRDHRKIVSIDGKVAFTGGVNITDEYANLSSKRFDYWKDAGIKITGPAVRSFTLMFLQQWNVQNKKNQPCENFENFIPKKAVLKNPRKRALENSLVIPYGDDAYNEVNIAENVYKYILQKAQTKVSIMTPYVIVDNSFIDDLIFTASRGVQVELIVPKHYDHFVSFCVGRQCIKTLIQNGIKVYAYESGFIHSKVFVADGKIGAVGSVNLDYRSFYHHFECGVFLYNAKSIKDAEADFEKTKLECSEITPEAYKKIPKYIRCIGWLFRIFAPLM
ncbi:MAG: cardiolipin synthase [Treponema sp.]